MTHLFLVLLPLLLRGLDRQRRRRRGGRLLLRGRVRTPGTSLAALALALALVVAAETVASFVGAVDRALRRLQ